jgi:hypothetical protein
MNDLYDDWEYEEPESSWSLYRVSAWVPEYSISVDNPWPIYAEGYEQAMDCFEILLLLSVKR